MSVVRLTKNETIRILNKHRPSAFRGSLKELTVILHPNCQDGVTEGALSDWIARVFREWANEISGYSIPKEGGKWVIETDGAIADLSLSSIESLKDSIKETISPLATRLTQLENENQTKCDEIINLEDKIVNLESKFEHARLIFE